MAKWKRESTKGFGDVSIASREDRPRLEDLYDMLVWPKKAKWVQLRLFGPIVSYAQHWFHITNADGKTSRFPKDCLRWNSEEHGVDVDKECPYCKLQEKYYETKGINMSKFFLSNAIVRSLQEEINGPIRTTKAEAKSGFKDVDSDSFTPVRVVRIPLSLARKIKNLKDLNKVKTKQGIQTADVADQKYGCDIMVMYDSKVEVPTEQYSIQKGERSPITEEEDGYLVFDIETTLETEDLKTAQEEAKGLAKRLKAMADDDDDEDSEDEDDDDSDEDDDDEDERPAKSSKKKPAAKKKAKYVDDDSDDEDEDDSEDEDEDDEDERPSKSKKSSKSKTSKKSKRHIEEEDDDEDSEDSEDEDDEDERPSKSSKKKSKRPVDEDDDDEDSEDDDSDEDDDDEDDDDDDDDDEDERPAKSKKASSSSKSTSKKKKKGSVDWDDL